LDYPAKAEGGDYKTDRSRYENIAEASATNLEKLCREQARTCNWREHGPARKPFDEREAQVVGEAYQLYRFGARMLEAAVRKVFKIRISHNCIHMYLKAARFGS
jgi:hypothetical protein